jgi:hypothetical protein
MSRARVKVALLTGVAMCSIMPLGRTCLRACLLSNSNLGNRLPLSLGPLPAALEPPLGMVQTVAMKFRKRGEHDGNRASASR